MSPSYGNHPARTNSNMSGKPEPQYRQTDPFVQCDPSPEKQSPKLDETVTRHPAELALFRKMPPSSPAHASTTDPIGFVPRNPASRQTESRKFTTPVARRSAKLALFRKTPSSSPTTDPIGFVRETPPPSNRIPKIHDTRRPSSSQIGFVSQNTLLIPNHRPNWLRSAKPRLPSNRIPKIHDTRRPSSSQIGFVSQNTLLIPNHRPNWLRSAKPHLPRNRIPKIHDICPPSFSQIGFVSQNARRVIPICVHRRSSAADPPFPPFRPILPRPVHQLPDSLHPPSHRCRLRRHRPRRPPATSLSSPGHTPPHPSHQNRSGRKARRHTGPCAPGVTPAAAAVDPQGNLLVVGDGMVAKIDNALANILATANIPAHATAVTTDAAGNIYVAGRAAADFPTTPGCLPPHPPPGATYAFVAEFSPDLATILSATLFGSFAADCFPGPGSCGTPLARERPLPQPRRPSRSIHPGPSSLPATPTEPRRRSAPGPITTASSRNSPPISRLSRRKPSSIPSAAC